MKTMILVFGAFALLATTAHAKTHSAHKAHRKAPSAVAADPELDGKEQEGPAPKAVKDDRHVSSSDADDPEQDGKEQAGPAAEAPAADCPHHKNHAGGAKHPKHGGHGCPHCR